MFRGTTIGIAGQTKKIRKKGDTPRPENILQPQDIQGTSTLWILNKVYRTTRVFPPITRLSLRYVTVKIPLSII